MSKKMLKVGYLPIVDHLILGVTNHKLQNGLESNEHYEIEPVKKFSWNEVGDALTAGEIDIAFMLIPYAMDLYFTKPNIKLILLSHRDGSIIVTNKRANINTIADFKGKTVLIPYQASMHHVIFHKLLKSEGLSLGMGADVMTEVSAPGQIPMMIEYDSEGIIGGYIVAEPFGTVVVNAGFGNIVKLSKEIMPSHPCCGVVVRDEIAENHPEAVQEFINSLVKSGKSIKEKSGETVNIAMEFLSQKEDVVKAILEDPNERFSTDKLLPEMQELVDMQNYLIDTVSRPAISGKIDVNKFVDLKFANAAGAQ